MNFPSFLGFMIFLCLIIFTHTRSFVLWNRCTLHMSNDLLLLLLILLWHLILLLMLEYLVDKHLLFKVKHFREGWSIRGRSLMIICGITDLFRFGSLRIFFRSNHHVFLFYLIRLLLLFVAILLNCNKVILMAKIEDSVWLWALMSLFLLHLIIRCNLMLILLVL